jgi:putative flippase GtrA
VRQVIIDPVDHHRPVNFLVNRRYVFRRGSVHGEPRSWRAAAVRYWLLVIGLLVANYLFITGLTAAGMALLPAKLGTEATLFAISYLVQRLVVFRSRGRSSPP